MPAIQDLRTASSSALPIDVTVAPPVASIVYASKSFASPGQGRVDAVRDVSLDVFKGEVLGLIGAPGAGKSTLLRLMNLLERPDQGSVSVAGQDLSQLDERALRTARQDISMVFAHCHLLERASVYDNVAFPLRLHGRLNAPRLDARVQESLALTGLSAEALRYPAQLTPAQRQRVALARALVNHPSLLLCDDPGAGLSPQAAREIFDMLDAVNRQLGVSIVIASHELALLGAICDRVAVLEDGRLAEQFSLADTSSPPATALGRELAYYGSEAYAACAWNGGAHA